MKNILLLILGLSLFGIAQNGFAQSNVSDDEFSLTEFKIEMKRDGSSTVRIGCAAEYSVSIDSNGIVSYEGYSGVKLKGKYTFSIPVEQGIDLIKDFKKINFLSLENSYTEKKMPDGLIWTINHAIKTTTTLTVGNKTKSVFNFYGAPKELNELQEKINGIVIKLQQ